MHNGSFLAWLTLGTLIAIGMLFLCLGLLALIKLHVVRRHLKTEVAILELTPPPSPHNTLEATEEFFSVLAQLVSLRSWRDLVSGHKATIALEVVSTRQEGIRYIVRMPETDKTIFLSNLAALAPTVVAQEVADYWKLEVGSQASHVLDLRQTGPRSYALKYGQGTHVTDPIAYVVHAISQLEDDELIAIQIVLSPVGDWQANFVPGRPLSTTVPTDVVEATLHKGRQPQFQSSVRFLVRTTNQEHAAQRLKAIRSALMTYRYEGYQSLRPRLELFRFVGRYRRYAFRHRLPALFSRHACLLATSELAALYHFPYGTTSHTEDIRLGTTTALPMPLDVKNALDKDVIIGENAYRGRITPISLSELERERHMYVVGGTGNGKSTLLQHAIMQDMQAGKGVAVIDPHGDLATTLLAYVPEERLTDVIYFNPSDIRYPIGLNLLELPPNLDADERLHATDLVTESIVSMFRKIFSTNDTSGHRIEYVLRNVVQTALTLEEPTLFTVYDLLNDPAFRKQVLSKLDNPDLLLFWKEFMRAGSYQQVSMAAGVTAKIGRFLFSVSARRILEQPHSSINFDELLQQGKILICNLSKGQLGEDTSELFGIMLLAKLQLAALRRGAMPPAKRRPFYLYVDEFQNFATHSFVQLLSEARKYKLFLTMAEQSTSQQSDRRLVDIVFANVGTIVAFRTSSQQDEQLLQPLLSPHIEPGTLSKLPAYNFYIRIAALQPQPPFSGRTILAESPGDVTLAGLVVQASRLTYGHPPTKPTKPKRAKKKPSKRPPELTVLQVVEGST